MYTVHVEDNYHFMREDERVISGTYDTLEEALAKCREIIDEQLQSFLQFGIEAEDLFENWSRYGDNPFVQGTGFSASRYAKSQSTKILLKNTKG